jgi:hypothetical protein
MSEMQSSSSSAACAAIARSGEGRKREQTAWGPRLTGTSRSRHSLISWILVFRVEGDDSASAAAAQGSGYISCTTDS